MKKTAKRFFSMLLVLVMVLSMVPMTALAVPNDHEQAVQQTAQTNAAEEKNTIDLSTSLDMPLLMSTEGVEVDEENPTIISLKAELKDIKVLNEDGESVSLTEEQITTILALYQQYMKHWAEHADVLGVQTPFFLSYNDNEDSLGVLGEILVLGGNTVEQVRSGEMTYDQITGMIQTFMMADQFGVQLYGDAIVSARNEILDLIEASGAQTDVQKYLVINNWLAQNVIFDMEYIMNTDKAEGEEPMVAEDPQPHEYYDIVYQNIYNQYEQQIRDQFEQQIRDGLKAEFKKQYYEGAIEQGYYQGVYAQVEAEVKDSIYKDAYDAVYQDAYEKAYAEYIANNTTEEPTEASSEEPSEEPTIGEEAETLNADADLDPAADAYAKEQAEAVAAAAGNAAVEDNAAVIAAKAGEIATSETEKFMSVNADAIAEDPVAFAENAFGSEAAAEIAAGWEDFWTDCEENGVVVDPDNAPDYKMTIDQIVAQQMDTPMADLPQKYDEQGNPVVDDDGNPVHMTPNEAIPVYAAQAATQLTEAVLNYWQGSHFGALGRGQAVCLGYTKAFTYLVQCLQSDIYTTDGNIDNASSWKTTEELYYTNGKLDISKNYAVDSVRITFDADVTMYGETQENFNSDHFWNAVQVDGKWYYIDPCYTDGYTEVMIRDRVETDGSMNHLYFMFSHGTTTSLYDGYYSEIKTLYADVASHTDYEDSWVSRIKSNIYPNGGYFYYIYDSTDMVSMMEEFNNSSSMEAIGLNASEYKLVRHKLDTSDAGTNGDADYETLIEFNYLEDEDDDESVARVKDAEGNMVESELLTALYAQHEADREKYPSLAITCAYYNNKVYFNLSNTILYYDLSTNEVVLAKEYNVVHGLRDDTNPFGGMGFSVVDSADEADFTIENHPIAGIALKGDGNLYVSIATNFSFISGKNPHNSADQGSYGYEFEESNFNSAYNSYTNDQLDNNGMSEMMGYEAEKNDNDEFMWSANFVETLPMSHFGGTDHSYEEVAVDAACGKNAYTENRCTTCGASEPETRVEVADTAHAHHYVRFEETYYTKADNGNWNSGFCYVCTECLFAISEPTEPDPNEDYESYGTTYEEQLAIYEEEKAIYDDAVATAGHSYVPTDATWTEDSASVSFKNLECDAVCAERQDLLDCLIDNDASGNDPIAVTLSATATAEASVTGYTGDCTEGAVAIYTATGEAEGYAFTATNEVTLEPGQHAYEGEFTWTEVQDEEGNPTGEYTAIADVVCGICGDAHEDVAAEVVFDEENSTASTCTVAGQDVYVATATVTDEDGNVIGTVSQNKVEDLPLLPHDYVDGFCSVCGSAQMSVPEILSCYSKLQDSVKVTWTISEGADGYQLYRATSPDAEEWNCVKTITDGTTDRYTNQGLEVGVTYYYKVRAFAEDAEGNRIYTDFSEVDYMPAAVVFDGPYSNATFRIRLRWNQVGSSHGYQIWRQNDDGTYSIVKTLGDRGNELTDDQGATTAYSNTGLTAGESYTYKMRAFMITEDGRKVFGAYSDEFTVAVMPETPIVTGTSPKATRAQLTWAALNGAAGYQIWMAESKDGEYKIVKSLTDGSTTYTKYDLTSGKTYYFKVRAYTEVEGKKTFGAYSDSLGIKVQ